ncbi:hypothetical protein IE53DRAFT_149238 [Violaceomyces palustris]|uniref:Uncharacterized protein n=1 Tax=Violaceomyces palustris TaxID=1673888 RepID=A0ACD0P615_9BASI|nr:hypothetical protein IE53DRAFT_149238 [Violaceomyces palustris]
MEPVDGRSDGGKVIDLVEVVIPATNATERILKRPPPGDSEGGEDKMSSPTIAERVSQDRPNKVVGSNKKRERKDAKARNQRRPATDSTEVEEASDRSEGEGREESEVEVEEEVKESRTMRGTMSDSKIRAKKTKDHQVESAFKDMPKPSSPKVAKRTTRYRSRKRVSWSSQQHIRSLIQLVNPFFSSSPYILPYPSLSYLLALHHSPSLSRKWRLYDHTVAAD